ncbi:ABC transporter substrate-binding protein [Streptomyces sp. Root63]|uniref:ABC transporter substrate-binding protein n=1 Tax=Streptomyces TaxID=1883 RepID=UPI00067D9541|nr:MULTISPECIES: ABC transporter substrate-binding protein [Streptomyces]KND37826.1 ABC transporter substrate-binding protein [Streptomyces europaeiscabiei]KQX43863.1 ABC transporter substrate-binding protein [Streptomyces sp. Root1295]KRA34432.1 ABC transporter substrate-binding protein [Streptomyces sp. Root63]WSR79045.1 ABC transporter substrate-binding protein [Streptomyces anulatus]WTC62566.1 ABC transporter substrate-binding protein [Streptomyces anulatus]
MSRRTRMLSASLSTSLALALLGACSTQGGDDRDPDRRQPGVATGTVIGGTPKRGGTLTVLSNQDFAHLDPARNWVMPAMDFGTRLIYRTLTTFRAEPGKKGSEIVPDLATDLGRSSDGGRTWTFTLKPGLVYEDGTPIRARDIKYNVERSFAPDLAGGPDYAQRYLADAEGYAGPLDGKHLDSIRTPDDRTIVFSLNRPVAEFSYTVTLPTFSPVPESREKGVQYDLRPFSSGPYRIESYARGKKLVLVRNTHWDAATDPVRKAYPDRIVVIQGLKGGQIDDRIIESAGVDASAVEWSDLQPSSVAKVLPKPEIRQRLSAERTGCTDMLALNTSRAPFDDPKLRLAMQYAVDKEAQVTANGGPALNDIATAYLPPSLTGGRAAAPVHGGPATGDVKKAEKLLAEAGRADGFDTTITVSTGDKTRAEALQQSLSRVGIRLRIETVDPSVYYDTIGDTANAPDMAISGWCPDYPSAATFLPFVFDGRTIKPKGNQGNVSQFRDKAVERRMDEIAAMSDATAANKAWAALDREIQRTSPAVPLLWERKPLLVGDNIAGAFGHPSWTGQFDFAVIGLKDPSRSKG